MCPYKTKNDHEKNWNLYCEDVFVEVHMGIALKLQKATTQKMTTAVLRYFVLLKDFFICMDLDIMAKIREGSSE